MARKARTSQTQMKCKYSNCITVQGRLVVSNVTGWKKSIKKTERGAARSFLLICIIFDVSPTCIPACIAPHMAGLRALWPYRDIILTTNDDEEEHASDN